MTNCYIPLCAAPCEEHARVTKTITARAPTAVLTSSHSSLRNTGDLSETNRAHLLARLQQQLTADVGFSHMWTCC